ncbi:MAG: site-2 protease family protein, partial [Planctomycetota bacterium]|nr:site-2 protease family protein [Planctomycetota bacterium]
FLATGGWLNLVLLALNLLPIPPLDGSRILASFSDPYARLMMHPNASLIGFGLFLMLFWFTSAGSVVFGLIMSVSNGWIGLVQGLVIRLAGG